MPAPGEPITRRLLPRLDDASLHLSMLNWRTDGAEDLSADGDDMVAVGAPVFGPVGARFGGAADYLRRVEADWRLADARGTIAAWVRRTTDTSDDVIFSSSQEATLDYGFVFGIYSSDQVYVSQWNNDAATSVYGSTLLQAGRWYHIVVTSDGSAYALYVDGAVEALTGTNDGDWLGDTTNRDSILIGALLVSGIVIRQFHGDIIDVRYHSEPKTASWVRHEFLRGVPDPSLVLRVLDGTRDLSRFGWAVLTSAGSPVIGHDMLFTGSDALRVAAAPYTFSGAFTFSMWLNPASISGGDTILGRSNAERLNFNSATVFQVVANSAVTTITHGHTFRTGVWQHLMITRDSSNVIRIYLNGDPPSATDTNVEPLQIWAVGARTTGGGDGFDGRLKDVRWFDGEAKSADWAKLRYEREKAFF